MEERDIEIFLKARGQRSRVMLLALLSILAMSVLIFLETRAIEHDWTIRLAMLSLISTVASQGSGMWVRNSRDDLIAVIERQIHRDPVALEILAKKKLSQKSIPVKQ